MMKKSRDFKIGNLALVNGTQYIPLGSRDGVRNASIKTTPLWNH